MIVQKRKCILLSFLFLLLFCMNAFTEDDVFIIRQQGFVRLFPLHQSWTDDTGNRLSETSFPIFVYLPLGQNWSMSLLGSRATVNGDITQRLTGFTDAQMNLNYFLESAKTMFNLSVNLPTGKKKLTLKEFETSYLISLNMYNFQVPNFGQGLNISSGVSWALPLSENFVLGLGAAYQYRGPFKPFQHMTGQYDPGDEILLTGGFDTRLSETTTFSTDIIYTTYGKDKLNRKEVFLSGKKIVVTLQLRHYSNYNELWLLGRYRSKTKNQLVIAGGWLPEEEKMIPDQFEIIGQYRIRMNQGLYGSILAEARFFQETPAFDGARLYGLGIVPEYSLSPTIKLPLRFKYLTCSFNNGSSLSGLEIGMGLDLNF